MFVGLVDVNVGHVQELVQSLAIILLNGAENGRKNEIVILQKLKTTNYFQIKLFFSAQSKKSRPHLDVERGWSGANEHFPQQNSNILHTILKLIEFIALNAKVHSQINLNKF
jgi:hypothetical protein